MEAVPKLPLIHFQLKISTEPTDFSSRLKHYIRTFYNEDPEAYNKEIRELENLRQTACRVQMDFTGCSNLKKYYCQLQLLQSRFKMSEGEPTCVSFSWCDVYSGNPVKVADIKYEQACILYNIGALHSELGAVNSRQTSEGMKISCTHFQCAAWAFQYLRDHFHTSKSADMGNDFLAFYVNVMLGQAQECFLEKSMLDNRKCTIVAKIAAQMVEYYKIALKTLDCANIISAVGGSNAKLYKSWKKYLEFKIAYHTCITHLYMGIQAEELQKMGERVAYFQAALDKLNEAVKLSKSLDKDVADALTFTMDVVGGKFNGASKENEFVYHEKVPSIDSLPEVKGASLVKGIPFDPTDPEVSGPDIFSRLVSMEAHEASSMYSEEKAKLLRKMVSAVEEKNHELMAYTSSLQPEQLNFSQETSHLPQALVDCCAALSVKPNAVKDLVIAMQSLSGIYHDVDDILREIEALLEEDEKQEKSCQELMGNNRPPSMIILEIKKELTKYQEAHQKASESNVTLHKAMDYHITNLNVMSGPLDELMKMIPSVGILDVPNDEGTSKDLQRLLAKIDEMKIQRQTLESQLREQIQADDITKKIVTKEEQNLQDLFDREIKKHDRLVTYIYQNLSAQENILKALTETNARYADTRKATIEFTHRRDNIIANLIKSYEAYEDLVMKSQKGVEFYNKLLASATKLLQRTRSVCKVQEEERLKIVDRQVRKVTTTRIPATVEPNHSPANVINNTGPKLKDYLKFMTPGVGGSGSGTLGPKHSNIPPSNASEVSSVYIPSVAPSAFFAATSALPTDRTSTMYPSQPHSISTYPQPPYTKVNPPKQNYDNPPIPTEVPSELRPAPVGSEQTDVNPLYCSVSRIQSETVPPLQDKRMPSDITRQQPSVDGYPAQASSDTPQGYTPTGHMDTRFQQTYIQPTNVPRSIPPIRNPSPISGYVNNLQMPSTYSSPANVNAPQVSHIPTSSYYQSAALSWQQQCYTDSQYPNPLGSASYGPVTYAGYTPVQQTGTNVVSSSGSTNAYTQAAYSQTHTTYSQQNLYSQTTGVLQPAQQVTTNVPISSPLSHPVSQPPSAPVYTQTFAPSYNPSVPVHSVAYPVNATVNSSDVIGGLYDRFSHHVSSVLPTSITASQQQQQQQLQYYQQQQQLPSVSSNTASSVYTASPSNVSQYQSMPEPLKPQTSINQTPATVGNAASSIQVQEPAQKIASKTASNFELLQQLDFTASSNPTAWVSQPGGESKKSAATAKDLLSGNNLSSEIGPQEPAVLKPKVLTVDDIIKHKEERENELRRAVVKDPLSDKDFMEKFVIEVERFQKVVESLCKQSLKGSTPLEQKWKELMDFQDRESRKLSISIARCYSMKNRVPDIMPYDNARVELMSLKDDYINASHLKNLSKNTAQYIVTQAPLPSTYKDFWCMIYEQQTEVIAALIGDAELKGDVYWPSERGQTVEYGILAVTLQSVKTKPWGVEHLISITHRETRNSRAVTHLQFTGWPPGVISSSPSQFLQFVTDVHSYHREQRNLMRPIVVLCSAGVGRSGVFCLVSSSIHEICAGCGIVDLWSIAAHMTLMRKYIMQDKEHMKFALHSVLYFAEDCLLKRGILVKRASFDDKVNTGVSHKSSHTRHPSQDFILGPAGHDSQDSTVTEPVSQPSVHQQPLVIEDSLKNDEVEKIRSRSNSNASGTSSIASSTSSHGGIQQLLTSPQHQSKIPEPNLPASLANLDAAHFNLELMPRKTKKIGKENFTNSGLATLTDRVVDPNDPLSQLDPLWSIHK